MGRRVLTGAALVAVGCQNAIRIWTAQPTLCLEDIVLYRTRSPGSSEAERFRHHPCACCRISLQ